MRLSAFAAFALVFLQAAAAQTPDFYMKGLQQAEAATASLPPAAFGVAGDPAVDMLEHAAAEDSIAAIVREARTKRVVLINETHQVPLHRAFAQRLAAELRKSGYSYLACESA